MSMLTELTIGGIRNFGSETDEQQKIQFSAPLTLIVGANGCGKTTIIECIKYALTGEYPPNSNSGQNFLNDPKQSGLSEVMGLARLRVRNVNEGTTTISRMAKVTVKGAKMSVKTEDSTLVTKVGDQEITLSKRKEEATEYMCKVMGVSKAIINFVLFCHQEESDWPLGTDQEVMGRFDKIFGTTEYNMALEKLRKKWKDLEGVVKDKKVDLKEFEMVKRQVDTKKMELQTNQDKLARAEENLKKLATEKEPIQRERNKILEIEQNMVKVVAEQTKVRTEYDNKKENRQKLLANIKTRLDDTIDELETKLRLFKSEMSSKVHKLADTKSELGQANVRSDGIDRQSQELDRALAGLIAQSEQQQETYEDKARYIREMCVLLNIPITFDLGNDNDRAEELAKQAEAAVANEEKKFDELQKKHDQTQTAHENRLTELRKKQTKIETELSGNREQLKQLRVEQAKQEALVKTIEEHASKLIGMSQRIESLQKNFDNSIATQNIDTWNNEIMVNHTRIAELNVSIDGLDEQIDVLSKNAAVMAQVEAKEKQMEKYESDIRRIRNKNATKLSELFNGEKIEKNYKQRIEQECLRLRTEIDRIEKERRANESQLSGFTHCHKTKKEEKTRMEARLRDLNEQIYESCHSTPFAEVLAETKENATKTQMEHNKFKAMEELNKDYISRIKSEACCPLCSKALVGNEVHTLNDDLESQIVTLPAKIRQRELESRELNAKLETLLALQPAVESVKTMSEETIPSLERELAEIEKKRSLAQAQETKLKKSLEQPQQSIEIAQSMVGDMSLLDDSLRESDRVRLELQQLKATLPVNRGSGLSLSDAQDQRKRLSEEKRTLEVETRQKEEELKREQHNRNEAQKKLFVLREQEMTMKKDIQSLEEKRARVNDLKAQIAALDKKIREMEASLPPIKNDLKTALETKEKEKASNAKKLKDEQAKLNELKQKASSINRCRAEIRKFAAMQLEQKINDNEKKLTELNRQKKELKSSIETIQRSIDQLNKEIADQGAVERNLQDNLDLLKLNEEIAQIDKKLTELDRNVGDIDFDEQTRNKNRLTQKLNRIELDSSQLAGQMSVIGDQINRLQAELNDPRQRNAVQNYRRAYYEMIVMQKMITDLQTYCETLERALTKYHSEKMAKINRLIRELWRNIYKGNDIDSIEIKTEESRSGSNKKRSYTYRVVQSKNDTQNVMRGNCSAGQRVLACLVIRIALAETFSANCGVLALDEPTTNLDRVNIGSLVEELKRFIDEREHQQNFMLLVITHDEEFIQMLGRSGSYHRVSRNPSGKSVITKLRTR